MNDDSQHLISAAEMDERYYSPSAKLLGRLDVENLHVGSYVDAPTPANVLLAGGGLGNAIYGELEIADYGEEGRAPGITVGFNKGCIYTARFFLAACNTSEHDAKHGFEYIASQASQNGGGAVIDSPDFPKLKVDYQNRTLELPNGTMLCNGDVVTIDPSSGGIWQGEQPVQAGSRLNRLASTLRHQVCPYRDTPKLAGHLGGQLSEYDIQMFNNPPMDAFSYTTGNALDAGLIRTEMFVKARLEEALGKDIVLDYDSEFPRSLTPSLGWLAAKQRVFRFVDLDALRDLMSPEMQQDLDNGDDHRPGTPLFKFRERLYKKQIERIGCDFEFRRPDCYVFLLPAVENVQEVATLKESLRREMAGAKFGVMMETKAALENTSEIAPLCDRLSYGTNDLTEKLTGLLRTDWMAAHDGQGRKPYVELTPDVLAVMEASIQDARAVNPDIFISACGYQVAGHDIHSIEECLRIGVNQIVVPVLDNNIMRAAAAIARYDARVSLEQKPDVRPPAQERAFEL